MSKQPVKPKTRAAGQPWARFILPILVLMVVAGVVVALNSRKSTASALPGPVNASSSVSATQSAPAKPATATASNVPPEGTMEVAKAVMVTVELDFGPRVPSIAEALKDIERRYVPEDGKGRTFAILDAYGEPTADRKLHMSMHVSSEKPGKAALVFKRTGEILWQSRIVPSTTAPSFTGKDLTIYLDDGMGKTFVVDGSKNPPSILDAGIRDSPALVRDVWPDGAEREMTYIYSACGCPVKVLVRRVGERTARTKELPVMFPDDPSVMRVIDRLMGW